MPRHPCRSGESDRAKLEPVLPSSLLLACSAPVTGSSVPADIEVFTAEHLEQVTGRLTAVGPRTSASAAEVSARDVVVELLSSAGLEPELVGFTWDPWIRGTARLEVGEQSWEAKALSPSPTTTDLRLELVDAATAEVSGKAALYHSTDGSRSQQFADALLGGADAMIRVSDQLDDDGEDLVEVGHTLWGTALPSVAVDLETGQALDALVGQELRIDIEASQSFGHVSHNVLATLPGESERTVFVTAHYDSWDTSACAADNALGVGTLVLLAQAAARAPRRQHTLVFMATAGEEQGVTGAIEWVFANQEQLAGIDRVLNLDIPWSSEGDYLVTSNSTADRALAMELARAEGLEPIDAGEPDPSSDHVPFVTRGVSATWLIRWPYRHYHTARDLPEKLDWDQAAAAARVNWGVLVEVAGIEE